MVKNGKFMKKDSITQRKETHVAKETVEKHTYKNVFYWNEKYI